MVALACAGPVEPPASNPGVVDVLAPAAGDAVTYRLAWDWAGAEAADGHRQFVTDLGYTVELTALRLSTVRLELVPCPDDTGIGWLWWMPSAQAAHDAIEPDASRVEGTWVEDAMIGAAQLVGPGEASGGPYCRVHHLTAPLLVTPAGGDDLLGLSLWVRGQATTPAGVTLSLDGTANLASGSLVDLGDGLQGARAEITLTRHPSRALDGLVLEELSEIERSWQLLRGLATTATATFVGP